MGIWIHNYNTNQSIKKSVDLYLYSNEAKVYPNYEWGAISGYNPNVFTNFESLQIEDETINFKVDFSGVQTFNKRFGDGGSVYCPDGSCLTNPWPYCNAFFAYTASGNQATGQFDGCNYPLNFISTQNFGNLFPFRLINPEFTENAKYWNDVNLWHNGGFLGAVLIQNNGPAYEDGGYEYVQDVSGHAISNSPCAGPRNFGFLDPETNTLIFREFECPCVAFGSSEPVNNFCAGDDTILTREGPRFWVMSPNQEPIPRSIKRYKIRKGDIPDNFPVYAWGNQHRITKGIVQTKGYRRFAKPDRSIPGSYGLGALTFLSNQEIANNALYFGQGDDGGAIFTVTPEGETIFAGIGGNIAGSVRFNVPDFGEGRCSLDSIFYKNEDAGIIDVNSWCFSQVYHPEESIENYPEKDPVELVFAIEDYYGNEFTLRNQRLRELNKPEVVFYQFPNIILNPNDAINIPPISDVLQKFPLKEYPYLSRESKNSFYENSNLIVFEPRRMLQASELNELQEKFYRKQKLLIEYNRKWLSKKYLTSTNKNILGISKNQYFERHTNQDIDNVSTIVPFDEDSVVISNYNFGSNSYFIKIKPNWYLINSRFRQARINEQGNFTLLNNNYCNTIDFINIKEELTITFDLDDILSNIIHLYGIVNLDVSNPVSCLEYSDLKDNSGGSPQNSPCGAKRNLLTVKNTYSKQFDIRVPFGGPDDIGAYFTDILEYYKLPFNSRVLPQEGAPHLLFYAVTNPQSNNKIDIYLANGVLFTTLQKT